MKKTIIFFIAIIVFSCNPFLSRGQYWNFQSTQNSSSNFSLVGDAYWLSSFSKSMVLTNDQTSKQGCAWLNSTTINPRTDWSVSYTAVINNSSGTIADGIGFHVQKIGTNLNADENYGYNNSNALSVSIITWTTMALKVMTHNNTHYNSGTITIDKSNNPIKITISYDASIAKLSVDYYQESSGVHINQDISINLSSYLSTGNYYVGFSGRTGGASSLQRIYNFSLGTGTGTSSSPFEVYDIGHLNIIKNNTTYLGKYIEQKVSINASGTGSCNSGTGLFQIGNSSNYFSGVYDGGENTISNLSHSNSSLGNYAALFGHTDGATIMDLGITNVQVTGSTFTGGLIGRAFNTTLVSDCYTTGSVTGTAAVGGLVGYSTSGNSSFTGCYSTANIVGTSELGGLIGSLVSSGGTIYNCYAGGSVTCSGSSNYCGGLVGRLYGRVLNSFSTGAVNVSGSNIGGLLGYISNSTNAINCFWDTQTSGKTTSAAGTGKTTSQMKTESTFTDAGWDFTTRIWRITGSNNGYPNLLYNSEPCCWGGFSGSDWNTTSNWDGNTVPTSSDNVSLSGGITNNINISGTGATCNNLVITTGADPVISPGGQLTVNGNLTNNGSLTLQSDATGTGSLIVDGTTTGDINMERYITAWSDNDHGWHFLSSPVAAFTIDGSDFDPGINDDFYGWDETSELWLNHKAGDPSQIDPGTGYLTAWESSSTKTFTGIPNNSDITYTNLSYTDAISYSGWHLLGNPFQSAILWDATGWNRTNVNASAKIWHEGNSSYSDISSNGTIPANQAFMVNVTSATNSITIPLADRSHSTQEWYKTSETNKIKLTAFDIEGNKAQETIIKFNDNATDGFDNEYDSKFLSGYAPLFYSKSGDINVSTNTFPEITDELEIPLYFIKNSSETHFIEVEDTDNLFPDYPLYLTDNKTGYTHNLSDNPVYTFTASDGDNPNRFLLHFKPVGMKEQNGLFSNIQVWAANQYLNIINPESQQGKVVVLNMFGQVVCESSISGNNRQQISLNVPAGTYIVKMVIKNTSISKKVIVK